MDREMPELEISHEGAMSELQELTRQMTEFQRQLSLVEPGSLEYSQLTEQIENVRRQGRDVINARRVGVENTERELQLLVEQNSVRRSGSFQTQLNRLIPGSEEYIRLTNELRELQRQSICNKSHVES